MAQVSEKQVKEHMTYLCEVGRPAMLQYWKKSSCIAATRLAVEYLRGQGVRADALACQLRIYSPQLARKIEEHGEIPDEETFEQWCSEDDQIWAIGLGIPHPDLGDEPAFLGHVVCLVENKWLLDLSIDQASRPERGMPLEPFYVRVGRPILDGEPSTLRSPDGVELHLHPLPDDRSFLTAPDWTRRDRIDRVLSEIS